MNLQEYNRSHILKILKNAFKVIELQKFYDFVIFAFAFTQHTQTFFLTLQAVLFNSFFIFCFLFFTDMIPYFCSCLHLISLTIF